MNHSLGNTARAWNEAKESQLQQQSSFTTLQVRSATELRTFIEDHYTSTTLWLRYSKHVYIVYIGSQITTTPISQCAILAQQFNLIFFTDSFYRFPWGKIGQQLRRVLVVLVVVVLKTLLTQNGSEWYFSIKLSKIELNIVNYDENEIYN